MLVSPATRDQDQIGGLQEKNKIGFDVHQICEHFDFKDRKNERKHGGKEFQILKELSFFPSIFPETLASVCNEERQTWTQSGSAKKGKKGSKAEPLCTHCGQRGHNAASCEGLGQQLLSLLRKTHSASQLQEFLVTS